jgi:hypothetical protein
MQGRSLSPTKPGIWRNGWNVAAATSLVARRLDWMSHVRMNSVRVDPGFEIPESEIPERFSGRVSPAIVPTFYELPVA